MQVDWSKLSQVNVRDDIDADKLRTEVVPLGQPVVFRNLVADWPAVSKAQESPAALCDYVAGFDATRTVQAFFASPEIAGRFFYSADLKGFNFDRQDIQLRELLDKLLQYLDDENPPGIYAGAIPLRDDLADILNENTMGLLDASTEQLVSIWIGNRSRTAAHWDLAQNIACVVSGRRRFTLFPPDELQNLYVGPLDFTLAGQPISLVDFHEPDYERFPRFEKALANAQVAELGPGDALYIPSIWFHHVESLDSFGMLLNYWWRDAAPYMFTPLITMLHALLSIRDLPKNERNAWRTMFEHYIFEADGDPMAHVPEDAKGFFGEMTPDKVGRLRAYLIRSLGGELRK